MPRPETALSRRTLLAWGVGGVAAATLVGCGSDDDPTDGSAPTNGGRDADATGSTSDGGLYQLGAAFPPSGHLVAGVPQRMPLIVGDADGPVDDFDTPLTFTLTRLGAPGGSDAEVGTTEAVTPRADGVPRAYLPVTWTFEEAGTYVLATRIDGSPASATVQVGEAGSTTLPQPGSPFPSFATPISTDARGVDPICTAEPTCPLHGESLDLVLGDGRPTALLVSTPAYCAVSVCGPVLDLLVEATEGSDLHVIHCEVYANPTTVENITAAAKSPAVTALGMNYEPALFLVDSAGLLAARLDGIYDRSELAEALAALS